MARQVSAVSVQVEQKPDVNQRRVSAVGVMLEQKNPINLRRISAVGVMVETEPITTFPFNISGSSFGIASVSGTLVAGVEISEGQVLIDGTLHGEVFVYGLNSNEAVINGTLYGEVLISGMINGLNLSFSYLWNLTQLKSVAIGIANVSGELKSYLTLSGIAYSSSDMYGIVIGIGNILGLTEGNAIISMQLNGTVPVTGLSPGISEISGLRIEFTQNEVELIVE